jgi:transcriptional regulator with GAF, ATPase, and Fis domain
MSGIVFRAATELEGIARIKRTLNVSTFWKLLRATGGVLNGPEGAAARLGVKRTTLLYKMRRLGLSCEKD